MTSGCWRPKVRTAVFGIRLLGINFRFYIFGISFAAKTAKIAGRS